MNAKISFLFVSCVLFLVFQQTAAADNKIQTLNRLKRSGGAFKQQPNRLPLVYRRNIRAHHAPRQMKENELDPALEALSTEDLYRMIKILDMLKEEGGDVDAVNENDIKTLEYLMAAYQRK